MRIGLSFSRCVLDIVEEKVNIGDVLIIISRTNFDPTDDQQWKKIWEGYTKGSFFTKVEWNNYDYTNPEHEQKFKNVTLELWKTGRLHQPRKFGHKPPRLLYYWLEAINIDQDVENNPALLKAFQNYKIIAGLIKNNHNTNEEYDF